MTPCELEILCLYLVDLYNRAPYATLPLKLNDRLTYLLTCCDFTLVLPTANYLIAKSFILPTSFYLAVAITCLVLVFPESLSHVWITSLTTQFLTVSVL